jgi:hypothetical protein
MDIELTEQQRQALRERVNGPVNVVDPASQRTYVLLPREEYERLEALLPCETSPPAPNGVPAGIRASQEAYWRDLPELLKMKSSKRQWVAYHRDRRVGFAADCGALYRRCKREGIPPGEFYVDRLEPRPLPPWAVEVIDIPFECDRPALKGRAYTIQAR